AVFPAVHGALRATPDILAQAAIDLVFRLTALCHRVLFPWPPPKANGVFDVKLRKRALLCAGNFPEPTGTAPKAWGRTTGRETHRGPNRPREQGVLGENWPSCQSERRDSGSVDRHPGGSPGPVFRDSAL